MTHTVFSISNISVDEVVDRYVSSGISGAQRRESEFLRELTSIIIIIIIIMFYYAIMAARHTVQYTHIQSYMQIHLLKTQNDLKTVKTVKKGTELVKHMQH